MRKQFAKSATVAKQTNELHTLANLAHWQAKVPLNKQYTIVYLLKLHIFSYENIGYSKIATPSNFLAT